MTLSGMRVLEPSVLPRLICCLESGPLLCLHRQIGCTRSVAWTAFISGGHLEWGDMCLGHLELDPSKTNPTTPLKTNMDPEQPESICRNSWGFPPSGSSEEPLPHGQTRPRALRLRLRSIREDPRCRVWVSSSEVTSGTSSTAPIRKPPPPFARPPGARSPKERKNWWGFPAFGLVNNPGKRGCAVSSPEERDFRAKGTVNREALNNAFWIATPLRRAFVLPRCQ